MCRDRAPAGARALAAALATLIALIVTQAIVIGGRWRNHRHRVRRTFVGLYVEIDYNVADIEAFLAHSPQPSPRLLAFVRRRPGNVPHWPYAHHSRYYHSVIGDLTLLPRNVITVVVEFYAKLETLKAEVESLDLASYRSISGRAKVERIGIIWEALHDTGASGQATLHTMRGETDPRWLFGIRTRAGGGQYASSFSDKGLIRTTVKIMRLARRINRADAARTAAAGSGQSTRRVGRG